MNLCQIFFTYRLSQGMDQTFPSDLSNSMKQKVLSRQKKNYSHYMIKDEVKKILVIKIAWKLGMLRSEIMDTFEGQNLKYMYAYKKSQFSFPVILYWV